VTKSVTVLVTVPSFAEKVTVTFALVGGFLCVTENVAVFCPGATVVLDAPGTAVALLLESVTTVAGEGGAWPFRVTVPVTTVKLPPTTVVALRLTEKRAACVTLSVPVVFERP
jgi:hypothetical protein